VLAAIGLLAITLVLLMGLRYEWRFHDVWLLPGSLMLGIGIVLAAASRRPLSIALFGSDPNVIVTCSSRHRTEFDAFIVAIEMQVRLAGSSRAGNVDADRSVEQERPELS
jgi:hypothetical protein